VRVTRSAVPAADAPGAQACAAGGLAQAHFVCAPERPRLADGEVHVWRITLDACSDVDGRWLDAAERERAARLRFAADRDRYVAAHASLRRILGLYCDRDPSALAFDVSASGKPALAGRPELCFSLSHSADLAVLAVTTGGAVGADVEHQRTLDDRQSLAARHFSAREQGAWRSLGADASDAAFLVAWTRKEAVLKCFGVGLSVDTSTCESGIAPRGDWSHVDGLPASGGCHISSFGCGEQYIAAVACQHRPQRPRWYHLQGR
jgi:4'-phosphopantetheinyl transferase